MINRLARALIPKSILWTIRNKLNLLFRRLKAPRMLWGYRDASGQWRAHTRISDTVYIYHAEKILMGDNVFIGHYSILDGTGGLEIGEGCQIAAWNGLYTHSSHVAIRLYGKHYHEVKEADKQGFNIAPIKLGKYVFVGANAIIFPGVTVGDGAFIKAGAIVSKDIADFEIVAGNPAKVVGDTRKLDETHLQDDQLLKWYNEWQNK